MSRQDANAAFALSSFLYGGNAAYIEDLFARYETDPKSVDAEWQAFFGSMKDGADAGKSARGASWKRPPLIERNDLLSALDGQWVEAEKKLGDKVRAKAQDAGVELSPVDVQQATRDSVRALMLIRAYRIRGHFHAKLDPLGLEPRKDDEELDPRSYGFAEADYDRKIFLDKVLGLEFGTLREIVAILPDARRRVHAHLKCRPEGLAAGADRGGRQGDQLHARRQARDPQQAGRGRRF